MLCVALPPALLYRHFRQRNMMCPRARPVRPVQRPCTKEPIVTEPVRSALVSALVDEAGAGVSTGQSRRERAGAAPPVVPDQRTPNAPHPRRGRGPLYAALDLGTNNCRLLIARPHERGFRVLDGFTRIVRLGEGVSVTGRLSDAAMDRTLDALRQCRNKLRDHQPGRMRLIATEACRAADLRCAYHNHDFEFRPIDGPPGEGGVTPWELLQARCDPSLVAFEIDTYWVQHAGLDPAELVARAPDRFPLCHLKDRAADGSMAILGEGETDFAAVLAARGPNGFEQCYAELDNPVSPFGFAATAEAALSGILQANQTCPA